MISLFNWPAQIIQPSTGRFPSNHIECLLSHHHLTKTCNQLCLAPSQRQASEAPRLRLGASLACIFVSWLCSAQLIGPSLSAGDAMFFQICVRPVELSASWGWHYIFDLTLDANRECLENLYYETSHNRGKTSITKKNIYFVLMFYCCIFVIRSWSKMS